MTPEPEQPEVIVPPPSGDGPFTLYDELGRVSEEGFLRNGALDGELRVYSRGRIAGRYQYREGLRHGEAFLCNEAGDTIAEGTYHSGMLHGEWAYMDEWGNLVRRVLFRAGDIQGRAVTFYPSGKPYEFCDYRNGLRDGELLTYSEEGKLLNRRFFKDGHPISESNT